MTVFKKTLTTLLLYITAALSSTAYASEALKFVGSENFQPYYYLEQGAAKGPLPEIVSLVCQTAGLKCSTTLYPWKRALKSIEKGQTNTLILAGRTKKREQVFHFSKPTIITTYGFFSRDSDNFSYASPQSLSGKTVSVTGPSSMSRKLETLNQSLTTSDQPGFSFIQRRTTDEAAFLLSKNRLDLFFCDKDVGFHTLSKHKIENINFSSANIPITYHFAFSKKHAPTDLIKRFSDQYQTLLAQGRIQAIAQAYGLSVAPIE